MVISWPCTNWQQRPPSFISYVIVSVEQVWAWNNYQIDVKSTSLWKEHYKGSALFKWNVPFDLMYAHPSVRLCKGVRLTDIPANPSASLFSIFNGTELQREVGFHMELNNLFCVSYYEACLPEHVQKVYIVSMLSEIVPGEVIECHLNDSETSRDTV